MSDERSYTVGSGNVFADLGVPEPEEALAKAALVYEISQNVADRGLTQARAAAVLGIDQPKVSALLRGRLGGFSIERLCRFLNALDHDVAMTVTRKPAARARAGIAVFAGADTRPADAPSAHEGTTTSC